MMCSMGRGADGAADSNNREAARAGQRERRRCAFLRLFSRAPLDTTLSVPYDTSKRIYFIRFAVRTESSKAPPEAVHQMQEGITKQKHTRLFEAAEPLFVRYGYRKTTVEEICRSAGVSKRTFYDLFRDKADFFGHLMLHVSEVEIEQWSRKRTLRLI